MQLIDADALRAKIAECKAKQCSTNMEYVIGYCSAMSTVEGMIASASIIEAIPFDWFYKQFAEHPESLDTRVYNTVLKDYLKSQKETGVQP